MEVAFVPPELALPYPFTPSSAPKPKPAAGELGFGVHLTDHVFVQEYSEARGWHSARIEPYGPLRLDPAAAVLHYGQGVFEGLKAFRGADGRVRLFRPQAHVRRLNASAQRLCIPPLDAEETLRSLLTLVAVERDWVPDGRGTALYVRPTMIASEPFLGVREAYAFLYFVLLSPVGAYYANGMSPIRILVEPDQVRAAEGGLGAAKTGANYAAGLHAGRAARQDGFAQVLWLDAREHRYLEEVGSMNLMLRIGDEVVTPPLGGSILAGVTRDSALTLLRSWGIPVAERRIAIDEVVEAARAGTLREVWGTGTAAVVSPVGELVYRGTRLVIGGGSTGDLTQRLYDAITGVQYGTAPDPHGWTVLVPDHRPTESGTS